MRHAAFQYSRRGALCIALLLTGVQAARAQANPPQTVENALQEIASQAAVIFAGSVAEIDAPADGTVTITFAVEEGLRGVSSGDVYRMRVSTWAGGAERYHVGERALFLLHAPSAAGFSSPVGGERGIVPLAGDAVSGSVDLRWVATGVLRAASALSGAQVAAAAVAVSPAAAIMGADTNEAAQPAEAMLRSSNVLGHDMHAIDRDLVTGMLRTWNTAAAKQSAGQAR